MSELPCPTSQWPRFSALLDMAMDVPEAQLPAWLASLSGDDAMVRPWLARVLAGAATGGAAPLGLKTGLFDDLAKDDFGHSAFAAGDQIGPYRLVSLLGEGGMGQVWRATRGDDGPQREIALKLPHAEMLNPAARKRFARERDMLASLSHPHIAQLYDAGSSAEGHPYLALELVQGEPITQACRGASAPLERRIELVLQVLQGLAYAHQRLIVHRDIKPSNVLVTSEGLAKLLDFGIAKLLDTETLLDAALTQPQSRLATPGYGAPEQGRGGNITVAADLFSVGVLLFELCTGQRPFVRVPLEQDAPLPPSHRDAPTHRSAARRKQAGCGSGCAATLMPCSPKRSRSTHRPATPPRRPLPPIFEPGAKGFPSVRAASAWWQGHANSSAAIASASRLPRCWRSHWPAAPPASHGRPTVRRRRPHVRMPSKTS